MVEYPAPEPSPAEFERLVQRYLNAAGRRLKDFRSERLGVVSGMDGTYQIDVAVRFSALDADFLVLVECKREARPVGRDAVLELEAKVRATGAQKGILFSTNGFQSGAREYAQAHGIGLVQLVDGRATWFQKSAENDGIVPWERVPASIPRVAAIVFAGDSRSLLSEDYPDALKALLLGR